MKIYLIFGTLCIISFFSGWMYGDYKAVSNSHIDIVERSKTVYSYIKNDVTDYNELLECYQSHIEIQGVMKDKSTLSIIAQNDCRKSERDFILKSRSIERNNSVHFQYSYLYQNNGALSQYSIMYMRRFGIFSAGLGAVGSTQNIGFQAGLGYHF